MEARREAIEELAEAVQCHARTLALLGPELRRRGVEATREALVELMEEMEQMERQVAHLPANDPRRREQSLFASVELSLRRLSPENRERVRVLGVFHGGVHLGGLMVMMGWERAEVEGLALELVDTGLATANPYDHLSINPALCPFLKASLRQEEHIALTARWLEAMAAYLDVLYKQHSQNAEEAATLTLLELPNLFALLELSQATADPETTIDRAASLYSLLQRLGKPRLLERLARVQEVAVASLGEGWSQARFEANRSRIEQQLAGGQMREALTEAQQVLEQALAAGEEVYAGADYDLAMAFWLLGRVMKEAGGAQQALPLLQEAGQRFEAIASKRSNTAAEEMASACLTEQGDCLRALGQYDTAAAAYEEGIRRAEQRGYQRSLAVGKVQLGTVRLQQRRYGEALAAYEEARDTFSRLNEQSTVAGIWHQIGMLNQREGQQVLAEQAYNQSLAISVRLGNQADQAMTLGQLGNLYGTLLQRPEEAVAFYQRAVELYEAIGNTAGEGIQWNNLAISLRKLQRLGEARDAITQAIQCSEAYGYAAMPWTSWDNLADIETEADNPAAAAEARQKARAAYLAYRRDGGENHFRSGRLAQTIHQALTTSDPAAAASLIQQLIADPRAAHLRPFLSALQAITAGSRDPSLAEDSSLHYLESAELVLLIEALEGGVSS